MSEKMAFWDFNTEVESWMHAFPVADPLQRREYYYTFKKAHSIMQYFEVLQGRPTVSNHPMLYIDCSFNVVRRHADLVKLDLETVWNGEMAKEDRARHAFRDTEDGFEMHFAVTPEEVYFMTGTLQILASRG